MRRSVKSIKHCYRVFWAWQEDREAQWLQQMALKGWSLKSVRGIRYTFERSAPREVVYRLDFNANTVDGLDEYLQLYHDAGWEYVTRLGNWFYFRRVAHATDGAADTELYTDNASRLERYKAQLRMMIAAGLPLYVFGFVLFPLMTRLFGGWWIRALHLFIVLVALLYAAAVGRVASIVRRLQSHPRE